MFKMDDKFLIKSNKSGLLKRLYNALFPAKCLFCEEILNNSNSIKCNGCSTSVKPPQHLDQSHVSIDNVYAVCRYNEINRTPVFKLKYQGKTDLSSNMAKLMADAIDGIDIAGKILIPIPLHENRKRKRGFNQAELLAGKLSKILNISAHDVLVRQKDTKPLHTIEKEQRQDYIQDIFKLKDGYNADGLKIILIDDIFTTGTTANECAKALKKSGAALVEVLVFCG